LVWLLLAEVEARNWDSDLDLAVAVAMAMALALDFELAACTRDPQAFRLFLFFLKLFFVLLCRFLFLFANFVCVSSNCF